MKLRRSILLALIVFVLSALAAADVWNKTYNLTGEPTLRVDTSDANIRITASDRNNIDARVTSEGYKIGPDGIRVTEHQSGNAVDIEVRFPHHSFNISGWHNRVDVEIQVPRQAILALRTGDGRISVTGVKGDIDASSGDGSQTFDSIDGTLRVRTGDGRITANGRFDGLDLNTGDGRIEATALANSTLGREWSIHTGDGSVTLRIPQNLAADVDLHTSDGHISLDMPVEVSGGLRNNDIHGKINGGGRMLSVRTGDGSITLERS
jgi:DUF4097 and DUF4098 domain-containing protein YvlB